MAPRTTIRTHLGTATRPAIRTDLLMLADSTPALALIGATDLAVARLRTVPRALTTTAPQVPALAVSRVLEVAGTVETRYTGLAERGKELVERVRTQKATQDLLAQGRTTVGLTRAAVTTARRAAGETTAAARETVGLGRREVVATVDAVEEQVEQSVAATEEVVAERTRATREGVRRTSQAARKGAENTRAAAKGAARSARRTVAKAEQAVESTAGTVGEPAVEPAVESVED